MATTESHAYKSIIRYDDVPVRPDDVPASKPTPAPYHGLMLRDVTPTRSPALPVKDVVTCLEKAYAETIEHVRSHGDGLLLPPGLTVKIPYVSVQITVADSPRNKKVSKKPALWSELEGLLRAVGPVIARGGYRQSEFLYKRTGKGPWLGSVRVKGEGSWG